MSRRDPRDTSDTDYRRAWGTDGRAPWGRPLRAAFYAELPAAPRHARTKDDAAQYLAEIRRVRDMQHWTPRERERLRILDRIWERRARGLDARYNQYGVLSGRRQLRGAAAILAGCVAEIQASMSGSMRPRGKYAQDTRWPLGRPQGRV